MEKQRDDRARNWSFIVYPESAPENWQDILQDYHVRTVVSPIHDLDITKSGELKKPHFHILVMFEGKKSYTQICEMYTEKLCCTIPQKVESVRSLVRYFCHLDNPEKAQYKTVDLTAYAGVDLDAIMRPSEGDQRTLLLTIGNFINQSDIDEYCDLWAYALENNLNDWIAVIADYAYCLNVLLRSKKYRDHSA